jgi:two-component system sensor histidine kinase FlrB
MATAVDSQALQRAFRTFAELSASLESSYRDLEGQVARLSAELGNAQRARLDELEARERLAARLERLLEMLPGGVLILAADGRIREANAAAIAMFGEPLCGATWQQVRDRAALGNSLFGGDIALASGRWVSVAERALGSEPGTILLVTDVTESHLVRELGARRERLAALGELAARVAHQLRTPLAAALLYATQLTGAPPARRDELATRVVARLRHLEALIADMLGFARGGGQGGAAIAVSALLEDVVQALAGRLQQGGRLTLRSLAPELMVRGNRDALCAALAGIVGNSLDIIGPAAEVTLEARRGPAGGAVLLVSDNGPGIRDEDRERIFEPFVSSRAGGTGLGLAVAREVATAHGGSLRCAEAAQGALFILELPAFETGADDAPQPGEPR